MHICAVYEEITSSYETYVMTMMTWQKLLCTYHVIRVFTSHSGSAAVPTHATNSLALSSMLTNHAIHPRTHNPPYLWYLLPMHQMRLILPHSTHKYSDSEGNLSVFGNSTTASTASLCVWIPDATWTPENRVNVNVTLTMPHIIRVSTVFTLPLDIRQTARLLSTVQQWD